jgi:hypothetical protein
VLAPPEVFWGVRTLLEAVNEGLQDFRFRLIADFAQAFHLVRSGPNCGLWRIFVM